jgi:ABC-type Mn2+/Zn2+ transport system permease subunit
MGALLEPLGFAFFQRGLVVAGLAGALCGLVGVFVVVRSMSYIGHGLSHAVFGGAAVAAVLGVSFFLGAGLWGLLAALAIGRMSRRSTLGADAAIGVVTTASFAIGLVIQARVDRAAQPLESILFGNVLAVFTRDVVAVIVVGAAVAVAVVAFRRELVFVSFDPDVAGVSGVRVAWTDAMMMLMLSATVVVSVRVVGALLITAMLVVPAATVRLVTDSITTMLRWSPILGAVVGFVGMYASWFLDVPSGASITLAASVCFLAAYAAGGRRRVSIGGTTGETGTI